MIESEPPLSITVLPDFIHRLPASIVTFGLDSYIIPIIPSGTEILEISRPFGCFHLDNSIPIGSSISAIFFKPLIISLILLSFRNNLSTNASVRFFCFAFPISILFACRISFCFCFINKEVFKIAKFRSLELLLEILSKAVLDFWFITFTYSKMLLFISNSYFFSNTRSSL